MLGGIQLVHWWMADSQVDGLDSAVSLCETNDKRGQNADRVLDGG